MRRRILFIVCALLAAALSLRSFADGRTCYVNDEENHVYAVGREGEKKVALTFDDGPHPEYTDRVLDVLARYGVKATFFIIGVNAEQYPQPLARAIAEGHCIGSHTFSHRHIKDLDGQALSREFTKNAEVLREFGVIPRLFRPPEGVCDKKVIRIAEEQGCDVILWTVDTGDWRSPPTGEIVRTVRDKLRGGEIILMHDYVAGKSHTAQALEILIPELLSDGFEFVTVGELIGGSPSV